MSLFDIAALWNQAPLSKRGVIHTQSLTGNRYKKTSNTTRYWIGVPSVVALQLAISGCGFEPVAAPNAMTTANAEIPLKDISIEINARSDEKRFEYLLEQELGRSVSLIGTAQNKLKLNVSIVREGLAIAQNDTVTRYNLTATTKYVLQPDEGDALLQGETVSITALNATASQFTTSVSEREALKRLANDIARRISTLLRVHYSQSNETASR